jgi:tRNA A-37 threonylcarbamoyl transferase component Bud32
MFDGQRFFHLNDYGQLEGGINQFAEDPSGGIWIAASSGVYRFVGGRLEQVASFAATRVFPISEDLAVAAATGDRAQLMRIRRREGKWKSEAVLQLESPYVSLDHSRMLLYALPGEGWAELSVASVLSWNGGAPPVVARHPLQGGGPGHMVQFVLRDRFGCVWLDADQRGITFNCGQGWTPVNFGHSIPNIADEAPNGDMLLWGYGVVALGRPGAFRVARSENGLPAVQGAIMARDGTIWITGFHGFFAFPHPFQIEYWSAREGVTSIPWSFARLRNKMYAGLVGEVVALGADRQKWERFASVGGGNVTGLLATDDDALMAASSSGGVMQFNAMGAVLARALPVPQVVYRRLSRGERGEVWVGGTDLSLVKPQGGTLKLEPHRFQVRPSTDAQALRYQENTHKLWACYSGGLALRDGAHQWREFNTRDGLVENTCSDLVPMANGDVFEAYASAKAMALIKPGPDNSIRVRSYGPDAMPDPGGNVLGMDLRGRLWRAVLFVSDAGNAEAGRWIRLSGKADGFPSGMNATSFFADTDGTVWWGADFDVLHYRPPLDLTKPALTPEMAISAFSWDGLSPRLTESLQEVGHSASLTAHVASTQFDRRGALQIRYRVLPDRPQWRENQVFDEQHTETLDVTLGKLAYGDHTIEVQGRVFTGPWSHTVSRTFTVRRPVWLTWPLLSGYLIVAYVLGSGAFHWRLRRMAEDAALLPDLARLRAHALLPELADLPGSILDARFRVGEMIARGGFANVMDGYDLEQKQRCAIKVFRNEVGNKDWVRRRFEQEVAALQKIRHPHVVAIYAHGSMPSGTPYLVMEFVEGESLRAVLSSGPLPPTTAGPILEQLASALDAIHAAEIWHRDVTPENVIVRNGGDAVLIDFSISIVKDANETLHGLSRAAGTFDYMAPEQAMGDALPASDIFSLARVVVEMLTGQRLTALLPGAARDLPARMRELLRGPSFDLSQESIEVLAASQEFDPGRRPNVAGAFARPIVRDLMG